MKTTLNTPITETQVKIADWTHKRRLRIRPHEAMIEIARMAKDCHNCPTCLARATRVEEFLAGGSYVWAWRLDQGGKWLLLSRPSETEPLQFIANAIGLPINAVVPDRTQPARRGGSTVLDRTHYEMRAHVNSWNKPRRVIVEHHRVLLQITLECNHCDICSRRVQLVESELLERPDVLARWEYVNGFGDRRWISVPRRADEDPLDVLRRSLNLHLESL